MDYEQAKRIIEGLLFVAGGNGLEPRQIVQALGWDIEVDEIIDLCHDLAADFRRDQRGLQIVQVAGVFQMTTLPEHAPYLSKLAEQPQSSGLSQAALETLAIVAYKQPITRYGIEEIRGVKSERALQTLNSKRLIKDVGRAEGPGRPILYGTTVEFLEYMGIQDLSQLPRPIDPPLEPIDEKDRLLFEKRLGIEEEHDDDAGESR